MSKFNKHALIKCLIAVSGIFILGGLLLIMDEDDQSPRQQNRLESNVISNPVEQKVEVTEAVPGQVDNEVLDQKADELHAPDAAFEEITFNSIEEILENIDDPAVKSYVTSLPDEAQESIYIASLKQSVSKRLDEIEASSHTEIDIDVLFQDIDMLGEHKVMMPGEVESLKVYIKARQ